MICHLADDEHYFIFSSSQIMKFSHMMTEVTRFSDKRATPDSLLDTRFTVAPVSSSVVCTRNDHLLSATVTAKVSVGLCVKAEFHIWSIHSKTIEEVYLIDVWQHTPITRHTAGNTSAQLRRRR